MNMTSINEAEAILAPFWDAALSELEPWRVEPGVAHGLDIRQNWCSVAFEWARRPNKGPALRRAGSTGTGDATAFHAEIDAAPGWNGIFRRWHRTWDSPTPDVLTIPDDYSLVAGEGVEFYWQTRLPVETDGNRAVIRGTRGQVDLEGPENSVWRLDTLPLLDGEQYRLALRVPGNAGAVTVKVYLDCRHRQHPVRNQPQQAKED